MGVRSSSSDVRDVFLPVYIVAIREIRAEVAAAALLAAQRRARDQQADGDEARDAPAVAVSGRRGTPAGGRGPPRSQLRHSGAQPVGGRARDRRDAT